MSSTIDLRLAHYPTRAPILIELKVPRDATVRQLRAQISEVMQAEEHCLMRVFGRLFVEMQAGEVKRLSAIEPCDEGESLLRLGVEDGAVLYLEGPLTNSPEGVGMAIAMLSAQGQQVVEQVRELQVESKANRQMMQQLSDNIDALRAELSRQVTADLQAIRGEVSKQQHLVETLKTDLADKIKQQAAEQSKQLQEESKENRRMLKQSSDNMDALRTQLSQQASAGLQALRGEVDKQQQLAKTLNTDLAEKVKQQAAEHALQTKQLQEENKANGQMIQRLSDGIRALTQQNQQTKSNAKTHDRLALAIGYRLHIQEQQAQQFMEGMQNVKSTDSDGRTPLHRAAEAGNVDAMEFIISEGANVKVADNNGSTALHLAAKGGHSLAIEFLLLNGADVRATAIYGVTPLHEAARGGHVSAITSLLSKGADVKATTTGFFGIGSYTPLQLYKGNDPFVIGLLSPSKGDKLQK